MFHFLFVQKTSTMSKGGIQSIPVLTDQLLWSVIDSFFLSFSWAGSFSIHVLIRSPHFVFFSVSDLLFLASSLLLYLKYSFCNCDIPVSKVRCPHAEWCLNTLLLAVYPVPKGICTYIICHVMYSLCVPKACNFLSILWHEVLCQVGVTRVSDRNYHLSGCTSKEVIFVLYCNVALSL